MRNEIKKAGLLDYICMDARRAFLDWKWLVAAAGVFLILLYNDGLYHSVIERITMTVGGATPILAALMLAAAPYAASLCDESEYKYHMQAILRGSETAYNISKIIVTFFSSASVMFFAFLLDCVVFYRKYGLPEGADLTELLDRKEYMAYGGCIASGNYLAYILLATAQLAVLAGAMAVIGLVCSAFVQNRMLVFALPIAIVYVWDIMAIRFLGYDVGCAITLQQMGVESLHYQAETQARWLYYIEILAVLVCGGTILCVKQKRK